MARTPVHPRHAAATRRARGAFALLRGMHALRVRAQEIERLPRKLWRGRPVYRLTCRADFGRGEHALWLPEHTLWTLIDLEWFRCPYHA